MHHSPWSLCIAMLALIALIACDTTRAENKPPTEQTQPKDAKKKETKATQKGKKASSKTRKTPGKSTSDRNSKANKGKSEPKTSKTTPSKPDVVAEGDKGATEKSPELNLDKDSKDAPPDAEKPDEETLKRDAAKDRRESPDLTPQLAKPETNPINTLGDTFKEVTSLVVVERNIPFKVLQFSNRTFTITDPDTIAGFLKAAGADAGPEASCPNCMTTFTVTAKDARGQDKAHLEMYCGGAVSTPIIQNTFTSQCWTVKDHPGMKSLLEAASR